ncbi:lanthionine synthetase LanC family protein [Hymenobacter sp. HDW8]|uniref:lanthionine synthetase LanC family protein n=1 Tax=Hymenobacter sp. HDW8 TaxID=2714932 RepID=UPI00140B936B|nr:lanthionine synthetase LanC family protein [Hymenobacter sp. HDW8]QIL74998.1 hypothetical protein G7064_03355 [Hymenobacter sp. HDW8]
METALSTAQANPATTPASGAFLETAADIGRSLCRDAIWHGDRCNFLTSTNDPAFTYPKPYFKALEADFYGGAAGVGFFLAALGHATNDALFRQIALGTLRNALLTAHRIAPQAALGFFVGRTGVAYAAIRAGQWLHDEKTLLEGRQLLEHVTSLDLHLTGLDVVDGAAGAIPALIQLEREYPYPALRSFIVQLADQLVSKAQQSVRGWSWNTITGGDHPNLTGFAHGVAGIVNALLEAYAFTQNPVYQEAAFQGLRYENSFFDQQQQNWPDFRLTDTQDPAQGGGYAAGSPCSCAWCHGAPGIALSRLRGYELTLHPALKAEAITAVKTTAAHSSWDQQQNFSLCHGLSGNADVLLEAADVLALAQYQQQTAAIGREGQERYRTTELWATGLYNAYQLPDFMLGLAGIGYFYLRLTNPHVYPSVLLLR